MKKKLLSILLIGGLVVTLTGCGSSEVKEEDVAKNLNDTMTQCTDQKELSDCIMIWRLQEYLTTYSSYRLLDASKEEFSTKPQEPNSLFSYGASRDALCAYQYALFYNKDNEKYYSVDFECDEDRVPTFKTVKDL